jgi:hypothetical protein
VNYNSSFFSDQMDGSYASARTVMPHLISLCHPECIVDFGCGVGSWLKACRESGIHDITGVDGDYVQRQLLMIPPDNFVSADLTRPVDLGKRFDLVLSLEVAEHLPPGAASTFVDTLTRHGDIILFSAAIPTQGGIHHVNEQWAQYWRGLFAQRAYVCIDCLREVFWDADKVEWWYRQNMFLYVAEHAVSRYPSLLAARSRSTSLPINLLHPDYVDRDIGLRTLLRQVPDAVGTTFRRLVHRFIAPAIRKGNLQSKLE